MASSSAPHRTSPPPSSIRAAERQGLCHVGVVVRRLLALYGIEEFEEDTIPVERSRPAARSIPRVPPLPPVRLAQQTFPFFASAAETSA